LLIDKILLKINRQSNKDYKENESKSNMLKVKTHKDIQIDLTSIKNNKKENNNNASNITLEKLNRINKIGNKRVNIINNINV